MGDALTEIVNKLKKKYGAAVMQGTDLKNLELERVSTGSLSLDVETGGGLPFGRIVEIYGRESSGKSTVALKVAANVQKAGKSVVWIDVEGAFDPIWAATLGVDLKALTLMKPQTGEEAVEMLEAVVRSNELGAVVFDSIAAVMPMEELEKNITEDSEKIGSRPLLMGRASRRLMSALNTYDENNQWNQCLVVLLNQIREKIGIVYGSPETTPGGRAIPHAASIRIRFARGEWIEQETEGSEKIKIGHAVRFQTTKNKTAPPYREGEFILYTSGDMKGQIDTVEEVARYGQLYSIIQVEGRTYKYGEVKAVNRGPFLTLLRNDPKLVNQLRKEVLDVMKHRNT